MYKKIPKTKKLAASVFVMVLMAVGIFMFGLGSMRLIVAPVVAQFFGVVFLTTGIYIMSTKVLKEMVHEIRPTDREVSEEEIISGGNRAKYDFIVSQHKGFRDIVNSIVD